MPQKKAKKRQLWKHPFVPWHKGWYPDINMASSLKTFARAGLMRVALPQLSQAGICHTDTRLDPKRTSLINLTNCHCQNLRLDLWPSIASVFRQFMSGNSVLTSQCCCSGNSSGATDWWQPGGYKSRRVMAGGSKTNRISSLKQAASH